MTYTVQGLFNYLIGINLKDQESTESNTQFNLNFFQQW